MLDTQAWTTETAPNEKEAERAAVLLRREALTMQITPCWPSYEQRQTIRK